MDEMMVNEIMDSLKVDLEKIYDRLKKEYQIVRAGRANPRILDRVFVDYYGTSTPLNQMANMAVPEARLLTISVWDVSVLKDVRRAIVEADLGVSVSDDGKIIRLNFPSLTEERRRELVKNIKKMLEDSKVASRSSRRDCLDLFKQMKKDSELSEDEYAQKEREVQKVLDTYIEKLDSLCEAKEKEIMEV